MKKAAVVGGGFIGLEMAENLRHAGIEVSLVEMLPQVLPTLDYEMAQFLQEQLEQNGVELYLNEAVSSFSDRDNHVEIALKSGKTLLADLVILAVGVRPNGELVKAAGLAMGERGGVAVDEYLRTSDPNIYAVGDVIEVEDFIFKDKTMIPLAGPANKQGRIAADNIAGGSETYKGSLGTAVVKVFELTAACTGANEKALLRRGLLKGKDYESVTIVQNSHAGYYPGALPMTLKLLFSPEGEKLFGAEIVGREGVDKRIDVIAAAIRLGGGVSALKELELAYAPPYSSAKDPVNMLGFVAENVVKGRVQFADWDAVEKEKDAILLDVREAGELLAFSLPGAVHIPLGELRSRVGELDKNKNVIVVCAVGVRANNAVRILRQNGFEKAMIYPGGTRFYQSTHYKEESGRMDTSPVSDSGYTEAAEAPLASMRLNCSGMQCPGPIMKVFETIKNMKDGDVMEVLASDPGFPRDIAAWCRRTGNTLLKTEKRGSDYTAVIRRGGASTAPVLQSGGDGKTIIVFSGDLDKVLASFIIANGAAAMGRNVTMFFTFWGLTALRKPKKQRVKKTFMEAMFGAMLPRGSKKLKISRMNMAGMGTAMMKKIMKGKRVDSLEELIQKAMEQGVKIVACTMSMDVMGIKEEELIKGVELGGVGAYLGDAEESNVNLFI